MNSESQSQRQESDRVEKKNWFTDIFARPEIGPLGVMILLFGLLGYFSIPEGEFSLNSYGLEPFFFFE